MYRANVRLLRRLPGLKPTSTDVDRGALDARPQALTGIARYGGSTPLKEARLGVGSGAHVRSAELRHHPAPRRALDEAELEKVGLVDVLDRVGLLSEADRKRREPNGAAVELPYDRPQEVA